MFRLNNLTRLLTAALVILLPFQFQFFLYQTLWGRGFSNPYTSIWLTAVDVLVFVIALLFFVECWRKKTQIKFGSGPFLTVFLTVLGSFTLSLFISPFQDYLFNFFIISKLLVLFLLYLIVVNQVLRVRDILEFFIAAMSLQALLAIYQFIFQGDLGLHFLGEPFLNSDTPNLARIQFGDMVLLRAYGTFPHPNILGGFLTISLLLTLLFHPHIKHERGTLFLIQFLGLLVTFSRTALFAFFISLFVIIFWYLKNVRHVLEKKYQSILAWITVLSIFTSPLIYLWVNRSISILQDGAFQDRLAGIKQSLELFLIHPFGVGYSHFTLFIDEVSEASLLPWQYQPVHNVFLLSLSETGIIGMLSLVLLTVFIFKRLLVKRKKLLSRRQQYKKRIFIAITLAILIIVQFDHYFMSLDQGAYLIVVLFGILTVFSSNPRHILPIKKGEPLGKILDGR